jgi:hypothetical protein
MNTLYESLLADFDELSDKLDSGVKQVNSIGEEYRVADVSELEPGFAKLFNIGKLKNTKKLWEDNHNYHYYFFSGFKITSLPKTIKYIGDILLSCPKIMFDSSKPTQQTKELVNFGKILGDASKGDQLFSIIVTEYEKVGYMVDIIPYGSTNVLKYKLLKYYSK